MTNNLKNYTELSKLKTFEERFEYLKLDGVIGENTFGFDRYINQKFYKSKEWKDIRNYVIARDKGCDLGSPDHEIYDKIIVHHMNPINKNNIINSDDILLNPEYLITTTISTHEGIHYSNYDLVNNKLVERKPNDTCPWKH